MNQKLCKKLRKQARNLTVGKPACRQFWETATNKKGQKLAMGFVVNNPNSTRGVYRRLKKQVSA